MPASAQAEKDFQGPSAGQIGSWAQPFPRMWKLRPSAHILRFVAGSGQRRMSVIHGGRHHRQRTPHLAALHHDVSAHGLAFLNDGPHGRGGLRDQRRPIICCDYRRPSINRRNRIRDQGRTLCAHGQRRRGTQFRIRNQHEAQRIADRRPALRGNPGGRSGALRSAASDSPTTARTPKTIPTKAFMIETSALRRLRGFSLFRLAARRK
jgi:hypothetical protein